MLKNSEVKKLLIVNFIILFFAILFCILLGITNFNTYKKELIKNNSNLIGSIIKDHPELEVQIINNLMDNNFDNAEYGLEILKKYGLDDIKYLDYLSNNNKLKTDSLIYNIIVVIFIFMAYFIVHYVFLRKQYAKINKIDKYLDNILNDNYNFDIRDYMEGDISNLKNDIYKVTVRLKEQNELSLKNKKALEDTLADISHQIKTPLTSMNVINDILIDNELDHKSQIEFLNKNRNQLERIEWLVTTLLKISRLDSGTVVLKREKVNICSLIEKTIEPIRILAELKSITIDTSINSDYFSLDFNWTVEALTNILKNACEHTNNNGKILIEVLDNPLYLNIKITDNGSGMSKEEQKHIFERFYKGAHNKDSIGIGLNMAKKVIDLQNGSIDCISNKDIGTTFDIKFYKKVI